MISLYNSKFHEKILKKYGRGIRRSYFPVLYFLQKNKAAGQKKRQIFVRINLNFHKTLLFRNIPFKAPKDEKKEVSAVNFKTQRIIYFKKPETIIKKPEFQYESLEFWKSEQKSLISKNFFPDLKLIYYGSNNKFSSTIAQNKIQIRTAQTKEIQTKALPATKFPAATFSGLEVPVTVIQTKVLPATPFPIPEVPATAIKVNAIQTKINNENVFLKKIKSFFIHSNISEIPENSYNIHLTNVKNSQICLLNKHIHFLNNKLHFFTERPLFLNHTILFSSETSDSPTPEAYIPISRLMEKTLCGIAWSKSLEEIKNSDISLWKLFNKNSQVKRSSINQVKRSPIKTVQEKRIPYGATKSEFFKIYENPFIRFFAYQKLVRALPLREMKNENLQIEKYWDQESPKYSNLNFDIGKYLQKIDLNESKSRLGKASKFRFSEKRTEKRTPNFWMPQKSELISEKELQKWFNSKPFILQKYFLNKRFKTSGIPIQKSSSSLIYFKRINNAYRYKKTGKIFQLNQENILLQQPEVDTEKKTEIFKKIPISSIEMKTRNLQPIFRSNFFFKFEPFKFEPASQKIKSSHLLDTTASSSTGPQLTSSSALNWPISFSYKRIGNSQLNLAASLNKGLVRDLSGLQKTYSLQKTYPFLNTFFTSGNQVNLLFPQKENSLHGRPKPTLDQANFIPSAKKSYLRGRPEYSIYKMDLHENILPEKKYSGKRSSYRQLFSYQQLFPMPAEAMNFNFRKTRKNKIKNAILKKQSKGAIHFQKIPEFLAYNKVTYIPQSYIPQKQHAETFNVTTIRTPALTEKNAVSSSFFDELISRASEHISKMSPETVSPAPDNKAKKKLRPNQLNLRKRLNNFYAFGNPIIKSDLAENQRELKGKKQYPLWLTRAHVILKKPVGMLYSRSTEKVRPNETVNLKLNKKRMHKLQHSEKNAPFIISPSIMSPLIEYYPVASSLISSPSIAPPSITSPSITSPSITSSSITSSSITSPSITSPSITSPSITSPSITPFSITPSSIVSNYRATSRFFREFNLMGTHISRTSGMKGMPEEKGLSSMEAHMPGYSELVFNSIVNSSYNALPFQTQSQKKAIKGINFEFLSFPRSHPEIRPSIPSDYAGFLEPLRTLYFLSVADTPIFQKSKNRIKVHKHTQADKFFPNVFLQKRVLQKRPSSKSFSGSLPESQSFSRKFFQIASFPEKGFLDQFTSTKKASQLFSYGLLPERFRLKRLNRLFPTQLEKSSKNFYLNKQFSRKILPSNNSILDNPILDEFFLKEIFSNKIFLNQSSSDTLFLNRPERFSNSLYLNQPQSGKLFSSKFISSKFISSNPGKNIEQKNLPVEKASSDEILTARFTPTRVVPKLFLYEFLSNRFILKKFNKLFRRKLENLSNQLQLRKLFLNSFIQGSKYLSGEPFSSKPISGEPFSSKSFSSKPILNNKLLSEKFISSNLASNKKYIPNLLFSNFLLSNPVSFRNISSWSLSSEKFSSKIPVSEKLSPRVRLSEKSLSEKSLSEKLSSKESFSIYLPSSKQLLPKTEGSASLLKSVFYSNWINKNIARYPAVQLLQQNSSGLNLSVIPESKDKKVHLKLLSISGEQKTSKLRDNNFTFLQSLLKFKISERTKKPEKPNIYSGKNSNTYLRVPGSNTQLEQINRGFLSNMQLRQISKMQLRQISKGPLPKEPLFKMYPGQNSTGFVFSEIQKGEQNSGAFGLRNFRKENFEPTHTNLEFAHSRGNLQKTGTQDFVYWAPQTMAKEMKQLKDIVFETRKNVADIFDSGFPHAPENTWKTTDMEKMAEKILRMIDHRLKIEIERRGSF